MCMYVCLHICVWQASGTLSLLSLFGCLSASFSVFLFSLLYLLSAFLQSQSRFLFYQSLLSLASQHFSCGSGEQRSDLAAGMILTVGETFSNGAGSNSDAETGEGVSELVESEDTSGGQRSSCCFISSVIICSNMNGILWLLEEGCEIL